MQRLKHVVIGVGAGIFSQHQPGLSLDTAELVGVSDVNPEIGQVRADELGCRFYTDHQQMLAAEQPDIAVILTPHPFHAALALDCFAAGCHVLTEKPMAVQVAEADRMIDAADAAGKLLAVNFQRRFSPDIQFVKERITDGDLGQIQHINLTVLWTRTVRYFTERSWRGTWKGEGGGLLMNQLPHELDQLAYLVGLPSRVRAWIDTQFHQIEADDTVTAMLRWPNGATGTLHSSTAEAGPPLRFEIWGTKGYIQINGSDLVRYEFEGDTRDYLATSSEIYAPPPGRYVQPEFDTSVLANHEYVYRHVHSAVLHGTPLVIDGRSARQSLELANALALSGYTDQDVTLPLDRAAYAAFLDERIQSANP